MTLQGLKDVLKEMGADLTPRKEKGPSVAEANKDWKRLASFMSKHNK